MLEREDDIAIVAARNAKWETKDRRFLNVLANIMEKIASKGLSDNSAPRMFPLLNILIVRLEADPRPTILKGLVKYYGPRLRYHVRKLLQYVGQKKEMVDLVQTCQNFLSNGIFYLELIKYVEDIIHSTKFHALVEKTLGPGQLKKLLLEIAFIRRPQMARDIFIHAAQRIPSFQRIKILLLTGFESKLVQPTNLSSLPCCQLPTTSEFQMKFKEELLKPKWVHAEIRMITHLLSQSSTPGLFSYLGISKKTCLLCGHIIQKLGRFLTRANHGKVYCQWTLPSAVDIQHEYKGKLQYAVQRLRHELQREAARDNLPHTDAVKESTINTPVAPNGSTLFNSHILDPRYQAREAEWLGFFSKRGIVSQ
jgi:hypothetical protein